MTNQFKTYYYYHRDEENRPIITSCFMTDGAIWTRGRAVCSKKDQPCKSIGRAIAYQRAKDALNKKQSEKDKAKNFIKQAYMEPMTFIELKFFARNSPFFKNIKII